LASSTDGDASSSTSAPYVPLTAMTLAIPVDVVDVDGDCPVATALSPHTFELHEDIYFWEICCVSTKYDARPGQTDGKGRNE